MAERKPAWQPWRTVFVNGHPLHVIRLTSTGLRKARRAWRKAHGASHRKARNG